MAHALKFTAVVAGKTLTHADLQEFAGKRVEVIVMEDLSTEALTGSFPTSEPGKRRFGTLAGRLKVADDFDAPLPAEIQR